MNENIEEELVQCKKIKVNKVTENGDYEKLLASVKFPIWDYDYDGLISNLKLILKDSGVKDKWQ
jgi:hypothetical protein